MVFELTTPAFHSEFFYFFGVQERVKDIMERCSRDALSLFYFPCDHLAHGLGRALQILYGSFWVALWIGIPSIWVVITDHKRHHMPEDAIRQAEHL